MSYSNPILDLRFSIFDSGSELQGFEAPESKIENPRSRVRVLFPNAAFAQPLRGGDAAEDVEQVGRQGEGERHGLVGAANLE